MATGDSFSSAANDRVGTGETERGHVAVPHRELLRRRSDAPRG